MKKLATIPSFLLTNELATQLKLQNQHYIVLIPKKFVIGADPVFDLVIQNERLSLIGPEIPRVTATAEAAT